MDYPPPSRWADKHTLIVLFVMLVRGALASLWPIWFAPPSVSSTLYLILMVLWREDATKSIVLLIVIGVIVAIIALTLNGSYLSVGSFQAKSCKSVETSPGQTEYTCKLPGTGLGWPQTLVLQGATGSSFARLVKHTYDFAP